MDFYIAYLLRNNFNGLNFVLQKLSDLPIQIANLDQDQWKVFESGRAYSGFESLLYAKNISGKKS